VEGQILPQRTAGEAPAPVEGELGEVPELELSEDVFAESDQAAEPAPPPPPPPPPPQQQSKPKGDAPAPQISGATPGAEISGGEALREAFSAASEQQAQREAEAEQPAEAPAEEPAEEPAAAEDETS
jgi:hypothetical protein